jgi:mannan endo-1,6-alpha-mannosidase
MNSLIDYSYLTGDSQFDDLVAEGMLHQVSESNDFMPPNQTKTLGNDDQSYWGLAAMAAAENGFSTNKLGSRSWVDFAINVFEDQALRWNTKTCGGGLNWQIFQFNNGYTYKNSVSTGNFFLLAARLAKFTGNNTYTEWAEKAFEWTKNTGLISPDFTVFDGFDERSNCSEINHIQWSSYHAIFTEGAAVMYIAVSLPVPYPRNISDL